MLRSWYSSTSNISILVQDWAILTFTMLTHRKSYMSYRVVPFSVTLNDPLTHISTACHYSMFILETIQDRHMAITDQTTNTKWYVSYWSVPSPTILINLQGHCSYFCLKISSLLFQSLIASPGDLMKGNIARDLECPLEVISGTTNVCISKIQHNVRSQLHVQWSDVLCKHLFLVTFDWKDLYDAEHDLLAVAEFLVPLHTVRII